MTRAERVRLFHRNMGLRAGRAPLSVTRWERLKRLRLLKAPRRVIKMEQLLVIAALRDIPEDSPEIVALRKKHIPDYL